MKILSSSVIFLICLAGAAWANVIGPGPEISSGIIGLTLAAGVVYLINRRKRS
jgi:hypothetical protein